MNARIYRVKFNLSPLDFPEIKGLGRLSYISQTEPPFISGNKIALKITVGFAIAEGYANNPHEVLKVECLYEIPVNEIKTGEDIYEFYKDATLTLSEAYKFAQSRIPLPDLSFSTQPMKTYESEIGGVLYLVNSQN
jgi:hypothetical protein